MQGKPKEVKAALQAQPAPSAATRQMCAARLIALLDSATKAAQAPPGPIPVNTKKLSKTKKRKAAELVAEAAAAAPTAEAAQAARLETPFLTETVAFVSKVQRTAGVSLAAELPEEMDAALSQLRESEALAGTKLAAGATGQSCTTRNSYCQQIYTLTVLKIKMCLICTRLTVRACGWSELGEILLVNNTNSLQATQLIVLCQVSARCA